MELYHYLVPRKKIQAWNVIENYWRSLKVLEFLSSRDDNTWTIFRLLILKKSNLKKNRIRAIFKHFRWFYWENVLDMFLNFIVTVLKSGSPDVYGMTQHETNVTRTGQHKKRSSRTNLNVMNEGQCRRPFVSRLWNLSWLRLFLFR